MSEGPQDFPIAQPAALDYARALQPGEVPEYLPAVEAAINRNAPIREVCRPFHGVGEARAYIRMSIARRFPSASLGHACVECGTLTYGMLVMTWTFVPRKGRFDRRVNDDVFRVQTVDTHHRVCFACATRMDRETAGHRRRRYIAGLVLAVGAAICWFAAEVANGHDAISEESLELAGFVAMAVGVGWLAIESLTRPARVLPQIEAAAPSWLKVVDVSAWQEFGGRPT